MKLLLIDCDLREAAAERRARPPRRSHVRQMVDTDTKVLTPDGRIIAVLLRGAIPINLLQPAFRLWRTVEDLPTNRATAMGTRSLPRSMSRNGDPSPRSGVNEHAEEVLKNRGVRQGNLGWDEQRKGPSRLTIKCPDMLNKNKTIIKLVNKLYKYHLPIFYAIQRAAVKRNPRARLWHTSFSSVYILKGRAYGYHKDTNNLHGTMTALIAMGEFSGGELVFPRWRIGFKYGPGDLLLFSPQELHANLPFTGERVSAALYCARVTSPSRINVNLTDSGAGNGILESTTLGAHSSKIKTYLKTRTR